MRDETGQNQVGVCGRADRAGGNEVLNNRRGRIESEGGGREGEEKGALKKGAVDPLVDGDGRLLVGMDSRMGTKTRKEDVRCRGLGAK